MSRPLRVSFVSLGCAKNLVDSEKMLGQIVQSGCHLAADEADADVVVINTCGFLGASRDEALDAIQQAVEQKKSGNVRRVVVAGCLVQRDGKSLLDQVEGIDALVGVNNRDDVVKAVLATSSKAAKKTKRRSVDLHLGEYYPRADDDTARLRITPRHYAYLRISEGCDQKCTFCTIPSIRGPMHCKSPEAILAEARELVDDGAVEISLIGQDTTSYGFDIGYAAGLAGLLRQLDRVDGLEWLRLMYVYPSVMTDEIIDAVADCKRVVKYIDMPLQHINDRVLKAMYRRVNRATTEDLLQRIRGHIPGVSLRTTMIVGFPGETDAEFQDLLDFVRQFKFDMLGAFVYSQEEGTPSFRMKEQVPDDVKQDRYDALMLAQQEVAFELADARIGQTFDVLVDGPCHDGQIPARHAGQAPQVDSLTLLTGRDDPDLDPAPGSFVSVRCIQRQDYDLIAAPTRVPLSVVNPTGGA